MSDRPNSSLERRSIRRSFDAAVDSYDEAAVLQRAVADELIDRVDGNIPQHARILDLGSGTGYLAEQLSRRCPGADLHALDLSPAMSAASSRRAGVSAVCGAAESPPFDNGSFDIVLSNMMLQWCDVGAVFDAVKGLLRPGGKWLFSTVGPDTLVELRESFSAIDENIHVHDFIDMHVIGDGLLAAGFRDPVMDVERYVVTYDTVRLLLRDLKALGAVNAAAGRTRGLLGPTAFGQLVAEYDKRRDDDGALPSTWEIVFGQAGVAAPASVRVGFHDPAGLRR